MRLYSDNQKTLEEWSRILIGKYGNEFRLFK